MNLIFEFFVGYEITVNGLTSIL